MFGVRIGGEGDRYVALQAVFREGDTPHEPLAVVRRLHADAVARPVRLVPTYAHAHARLARLPELPAAVLICLRPGQHGVQMADHVAPTGGGMERGLPGLRLRVAREQVDLCIRDRLPVFVDDCARQFQQVRRRQRDVERDLAARRRLIRHDPVLVELGRRLARLDHRVSGPKPARGATLLVRPWSGRPEGQGIGRAIALGHCQVAHVKAPFGIGDVGHPLDAFGHAGHARHGTSLRVRHDAPHAHRTRHADGHVVERLARRQRPDLRVPQALRRSVGHQRQLRVEVSRRDGEPAVLVGAHVGVLVTFAPQPRGPNGDEGVADRGAVGINDTPPHCRHALSPNRDVRGLARPKMYLRQFVGPPSWRALEVSRRERRGQILARRDAGQLERAVLTGGRF